MTAAYVADTDGLGLGRPDHEPLAGETIGPIVDLIQALIDSGSAYAVEGDVYFRVRSDARYGELSHRSVDAMDQGEGVEGAQLKEDPLDFALWKAQKEGEDTAWDAPWGRGRPGWHIECSAMAEELLGVGFDIHGGGNDLVFPHHENEAAQTRMARGAELAAIWMHNGMLQLGDEKMAKSVGNIALLGDVLERWGRDARDPVLRRRPLPPAAALLRRDAGAGAGRRQAPARGRAAARRRRPRRTTWRAIASASSTRSPRTSTRRARWPRSGAGSPRPTSARPSATRTCATMLGVLGLDNLLDAGDGDGPDEAALALLARRERARADEGLGAGRPDARRARRARLGGPRRRPDGAALRPRRDPLRAQRRPRGAARRAPRRCTRSGRRRGAASEPWLARRRRSSVVGGDEIERLAGSQRPPGDLRGGRAVSVRRRAPTCSTRPTR